MGAAELFRAVRPYVLIIDCGPAQDSFLGMRGRQTRGRGRLDWWGVASSYSERMDEVEEDVQLPMMESRPTRAPAPAIHLRLLGAPQITTPAGLVLPGKPLVFAA